jgi:hypothetical protein
MGAIDLAPFQYCELHVNFYATIHFVFGSYMTPTIIVNWHDLCNSSCQLLTFLPTRFFSTQSCISHPSTNEATNRLGKMVKSIVLVNQFYYILNHSNVSMWIEICIYQRGGGGGLRICFKISSFSSCLSFTNFHSNYFIFIFYMICIISSLIINMISKVFMVSK